MKIYLDNCCYNRPYDDQSHLTISIEAQAKMQIQSLVKAQKLQLASSFILDYENSCNPYTDRKSAITKFLNDNVFDYVGSDKSDVIAINAKKIMATGVKMKDACHIACAELMNCFPEEWNALSVNSELLTLSILSQQSKENDLTIPNGNVNILTKWIYKLLLTRPLPTPKKKGNSKKARAHHCGGHF